MSERLSPAGAMAPMTDSPSFATSPVLAGGAEVRDFVALLKPRVVSLVVFTGAVGLMLAPGHLHPVQAAIAVLCIAIGAGAAGAINMWYERDIDALMARTRGRPIPAGRMEPAEALAFGVVLSIGSVMVMALAVNPAAAALLALSIGFYVFIYTMWLKRRTPQNIVIGGGPRLRGPCHWIPATHRQAIGVLTDAEVAEAAEYAAIAELAARLASFAAAMGGDGFAKGGDGFAKGGDGFAKGGDGFVS